MSRLHPNVRTRPTHGFVESAEDPGTFVRRGFHLVPCDGEAHSNGYIDNCSCCMPLWGWVAVLDRFSSLAEHRAARSATP